MKRTLLAALLALAAAARARAADVSWTITNDTAALLGAETRIVYRPTVPPGAKLEPDALASGTTAFAVVKTAALSDGSWAWTVLPLDEGKLEFVARWKLDGKDAAAPAVSLPVRAPVLPKDADIEDIKGPLAARRPWWPWALAAALLAAIGAYAWWWRREKARRAALGEPAGPPAPPLPPDEAAARAVAELLASGLWARGEHAAFYLRLTDILRAYLENRYKAPATAMTSIEVARLVKANEPDLKAATIVREVLSNADLVKFARIKPGASDGPRDAERVLDAVRATTPAGILAPALAATAAGAAAEAAK